jgi:hypothetical protein
MSGRRNSNIYHIRIILKTGRFFYCNTMPDHIFKVRLLWKRFLDEITFDYLLSYIKILLYKK